jgi:hypothetical protein
MHVNLLSEADVNGRSAAGLRRGGQLRWMDHRRRERSSSKDRAAHRWPTGHVWGQYPGVSHSASSDRLPNLGVGRHGKHVLVRTCDIDTVVAHAGSNSTTCTLIHLTLMDTQALRRGISARYGRKALPVTANTKFSSFTLFSVWSPSPRKAWEAAAPKEVDLSLQEVADVLEERVGPPPVVVRFSGRTGKLSPMY